METIQQQIWIASIQSTLSTAFCATTGQIKPGSMAIFKSKAPVRILEDQRIITHKPQLGPAQIPRAVLINRLFRCHFGFPLEHNQTVCHPRILTTQTSQAHPIASIGAINNLVFLIQVWSDLYASGCDKNDLLGHYIAPVWLLYLYGGKERQKLVCPYTLYYKLENRIIG